MKYWEKISKYNTPKLSWDTTVHQVSNWIKEINLGNKRRNTDEEDKAYWAVIYLDHAYAAEWRNHKYILIREGKPIN